MTQANLPEEPSKVEVQARFNGFEFTVPLAIVLLGYLCFTVRTTHQRLTRPWATSAFEVQFVMDAWRSSQGKPVYEDPALGHATHMYGPLITYTTVPLVKSYGVDVRLPRYVSLAATLALCIAGALVFWVRGHRLAGLLAFCLLYLQFYRLREWATGSRPDAHAMLLAFGAAILFYRGWATLKLNRAVMWTLFGTLVMFVGFFYKQTAGCVALLPPVILLLRPHPAFLKRLAISLVPFIALVGVIFIIRLTFPWVYHYMIHVPAQYPINWSTAVLGLFELLRFNTLFIAGVVGWAILDRRVGNDDAIDLWLLVSILVLSIPCVIARAKWGGSYNSYLPVYIPMALFAAKWIPSYLRRLASPKTPMLYAWGVSVIVAVLPLADVTSTVRTLNPGAVALEHGGPNVQKVIEVARHLPGTFISPDDPTIALHAKGYTGRTALIELDANGHVMPPHVLEELRGADWVLQVSRGWPSSIPDPTLVSLGFEETLGIIPVDPVYSLWRRATRTTPPS